MLLMGQRLRMVQVLLIEIESAYEWNAHQNTMTE